MVGGGHAVLPQKPMAGYSLTVKWVLIYRQEKALKTNYLKYNFNNINLLNTPCPITYTRVGAFN